MTKQSCDKPHYYQWPLNQPPDWSGDQKGLTNLGNKKEDILLNIF